MRKLLIATLLAVTAALLSPVPANALSYAIQFDSLPDGTVITDQLMDQGIEFGNPTSLGVALSPASNGGPSCPQKQVVHHDVPSTVRSVKCLHWHQEFQVYSSMVMFRLTTTRNFVSFTARTTGAQGVSFTASSYDVDGNRLQEFTATNSATNFDFTSPDNNIAYVYVEYQQEFEIGPVTVNQLDVPPTPFIRMAPIGDVTVGQTGVANTAVRVNRWNGSTGPVALSIAPTGALDGASFTPQILSGSAQNANLRVTGGYATAGNYNTTVTATPQNVTAGSAAANGPLAIHLKDRFTLSSGQTQDLKLEPCTTARVGFKGIEWGPGVTPSGPVTLKWESRLNDADHNKVVTSGSTDDLTSTLKIANPNEGLGAGELQGQITTQFYEGTTPLPGTREVRSVYALDPHIYLTHTDGNGGYVMGGATPGPKDDQGTEIRVIGGWCPGADLIVGNPQARARIHLSAPSLYSNSGYNEGYIYVPRLATSGKVALLNPKIESRIGAPNSNYANVLPTAAWDFNVSDYRDLASFAWGNDVPGRGRLATFDLLKRAFGNQVVMKADACSAASFGLFSCSVSMGVPTVSAQGFLWWKQDFPDGACWGYAVLAERIRNSEALWQHYNTGNVNDPLRANSSLAKQFSGPSPELRDDVLATQLQLYGTETQLGILNGTYAPKTTQDLISRYADAVQGGRAPLLMIASPEGGHALLAVDEEVGMDGSVKLWVVNPNVPVTTGEANTDGVAHAAAHTTIKITPDGTWTSSNPTMTGKLGSDASFGKPSFAIVPAQSIPTSPTWMAGATGRFLVPNFASASSKVTPGAPQTSGSSATSSPLTVTEPSAVWMGEGSVLGVRTASPGAGATASLAGDGVSIKGTATGVTLVASTTKQAVSVDLAETSNSDTLTPIKGGLALTHAGAKTSATVTTYAKGIAMVSKTLALAPGAKVSIKASTLTITARGKSKKVKLKGAGNGPAPTVGKAKVKVKKSKATVTLPVTVGVGATGVVAWQIVNKRGKTVAKGGGQVVDGVSSTSARIKAPKGTYRIQIYARVFDPVVANGLGSASKKISKKVVVR